MKKIFLILTLTLAAFSLFLFNFENTNAQDGNVVANLKTLFGEYYNSGVYVKSTKINVNEVVQNEVSLFHAKANALTNTTYYNGNELWFAYGSGYGTSEDGHLTQFRMVDGVKTNEKVVNSLPGMEAYYCTLDDFVKGGHVSNHTNNVELKLHDGWTLTDGIYSTTSEGVLDGFRLFTAPLWLGKTDANENYIDYTKATVEEVGDTLVMKLWVSSTEKHAEGGKLIDSAEIDGEHAVFSTAVIAKDTSSFEVANGGFETGNLDGWTKVGRMGAVISDSTYWPWENDGGYSYNKDGEYLFSAYGDEKERAVGYLKSSTFTVGGNGWITFKLGGAKNPELVNVQIVDANNGNILKTFGNTLHQHETDGVKTGCTLNAYKANLSDLLGKEVYIKVVDNAESDYGLFFVDCFNTFYTTIPGDEFYLANDLGFGGNVYQVFNGDFERDLAGWYSVGEIGVVTNANGYWGDNIPYGKNGDKLFTGVESFGADTMREGNRGTLTSSVFEIGGNGYISFMLGGGGNEHCYIQVIDAVTNEVLARYHQQAQQDARLITHVADLSSHIGKAARIQVVDYASGGWGCVSFDNVVTYNNSTPEGVIANNIYNGVYTIANGSFESGLDGWHMNIWEAGAHNTLGWVESSEHDAGWYTKNDNRKDGNNLFTFVRPDGTNCENTKGELVSSTFTLNKDSFVSFRFGGAGTREVRIELVRVDGTVIARFFNEAPGKINTEMFAYYYEYTGETADCFFRVVDDSTSNYGCFVVDDFRANLNSAPEGFIPAIQ